MNLVFVLVPKTIWCYISLYCATVCFSCLISFCFSRSLSGANSRVSVCMSLATIQPQSARCGLASAKLTGWLHEKTASFRNSTHCTVWTQQLLSVKDKQTDRERRQRERERKREARRMWETWKYVREQRSKRAKQNLWEMQQYLFFFFIALLWQHVWNWNVIRC